jgi:hypothetical protein
MDETGLVILGAAMGASAKILGKLLGPTAGYLGGGIKNYTEKGIKNLGRVFDHAKKTLGNKLETPGEVPPKVLRDVLYHGYICEDELSAQYFGGVLASSRSGINRDDRGSSFIQLIGRLSTYQIRSHFIFYTIFKQLCAGQSDQLGRFSELQKFTMFIPFDVWATAMDFQPNEQRGVLDAHIMYGLSHEVLIDGRWLAGGGPERLNAIASIQVECDGLVYLPSAVGLELYLWAHGLKEMAIGKFLVEKFTPMTLDGLAIPDGAKFFTVTDSRLIKNQRLGD